MSCSEDTKKIPDPQPTASNTFYNGMDLSFYPQLRDEGAEYLNAALEKIELLPYFQSKGINLIRIRLWHQPQSQHSGFQEVLSFCSEIKAAGMEILLDLHYSDIWADPGHQDKPLAWQELSGNTLQDSVYQYTHKIMQTLITQNTAPKIVQIGNETNGGFLWPDGKITGNENSDWSNYIALVNAGAKAIRELRTDEETQIMLHFAGIKNSDWYFENAQKYGANFDIIGLSWYAIWHSHDLDWMEQQLQELTQSSGKKLMIVETAYPFTLGWNDYTNNLCGSESQLLEGYEANPKNQAEVMQKLVQLLKDLPNNQGIGLCYWAPEYIAWKGTTAQDASPWENMCVFDFNGKALEVMDIFDAAALNE